MDLGDPMMEDPAANQEYDEAQQMIEEHLQAEKIFGDQKIEGPWHNFGSDVVEEFVRDYNELTRMYHVPRNPDTARMLLALALQQSQERAEEGMRKMLHGLGIQGTDQDRAIADMPLKMPPTVFETVFQQLIDALHMRHVHTPVGD